jgi:hypothetical protein
MWLSKKLWIKNEEIAIYNFRNNISNHEKFKLGA